MGKMPVDVPATGWSSSQSVCGSPTAVPPLQPTWSLDATTSHDWTFHQIAPYIGRMKTSMASTLIKDHTNDGDLVVDPFCGCGTIALEAVATGRRVVAGDWNPYAVLLTQA